MVTESDTVVATAAPVDTASPTSVISARRVPSVLARPVADRRLVAEVQPLVDALPGASCVSISGPAGQMLARDDDTPLAPASNAKLLTGFAALQVLGPDTTFETTLAAQRAPVDGVVDGDLWMVGGGDPLLSTAPYRSRVKYGDLMPATPLESVADAVVAAGVRRVSGRVVGDESRYDAVRAVPTWPARYQADGQVGALSALGVNDGRQFAAIEGGTSPGGVDAEPAAGAAKALVELLRSRGVTVDGGAASGTAPAERVSVATVRSLTVREIVGELLEFSDNTTAELLVKEMGVAAGKGGTTEAGLAVLRSTLEQAGLPTDGLVLVDGSGLDRADRVSCATLDALLEHTGPDGPIEDGLPVAGTSGTLVDRYTRSVAKGKVRAKTGSLRDVTSLSGWVTTDPGAQLSFAIVVNTPDRQVTNDDILATQRITEALLSYPATPDLAALGPVVGP